MFRICTLNMIVLWFILQGHEYLSQLHSSSCSDLFVRYVSLCPYVVRTVCYSECTANSRSHTLNISSAPREILMLSPSICLFKALFARAPSGSVVFQPFHHPSPILIILLYSFWDQIDGRETKHCRAQITAHQASQVDSTLGLSKCSCEHLRSVFSLFLQVASTRCEWRSQIRWTNWVSQGFAA